jgi:ribosomal protein S27AE
MGTALQTRVARLEDASGGDEGCPRCVGATVIIKDHRGGFIQASWNGEEITRAELCERQAERECPRCGRKIDPEEATQIKVGGTWGPSL